MIGQAIKAIREERSITQHELAKRLGYSQSNISKYENGDLGIDANFLIKIARAMDCSVEEIYRRASTNNHDKERKTS